MANTNQYLQLGSPDDEVIAKTFHDRSALLKRFLSNKFQFRLRFIKSLVITKAKRFFILGVSKVAIIRVQK